MIILNEAKYVNVLLQLGNFVNSLRIKKTKLFTNVGENDDKDLIVGVSQHLLVSVCKNLIAEM